MTIRLGFGVCALALFSLAASSCSRGDGSRASRATASAPAAQPPTVPNFNGGPPDDSESVVQRHAVTSVAYPTVSAPLRDIPPALPTEERFEREPRIQIGGICVQSRIELHVKRLRDRFFAIAKSHRVRSRHDRRSVHAIAKIVAGRFPETGHFSCGLIPQIPLEAIHTRFDRGQFLHGDRALMNIIHLNADLGCYLLSVLILRMQGKRSYHVAVRVFKRNLGWNRAVVIRGNVEVKRRALGGIYTDVGPAAATVGMGKPGGFRLE